MDEDEIKAFELESLLRRIPLPDLDRIQMEKKIARLRERSNSYRPPITKGNRVNGS